MTGQIAIIGTGPSGCYLAQALLKAQPELQVDLIDQLPVPYGLVRYGVAPDHQGSKGVIRQFARLFERQGARFFGNLTVNDQLSLDDLRAAYDVVVLAAGLSGDRRLGVPGEGLSGVFGAGRLVWAINDHPDAMALPDLGAHPVIMGNGNVAIDLLRLLAKTPSELDGSDVGASVGDWLANSGIESLEIIGRSSAEQAKFDPVMVKELAKLTGVSIEVIGAAATSDDPAAARKLAALAEINGHGSGPRRITFRFGLTPVAIKGDDRANAVHFRTETGDDQIIPCSAFVTAIGFQDQGRLDRETLLAQAEDIQVGKLAAGLYATGWFRRGPQGTIPENRGDAQALAKRILADLAPMSDKQGAALFASHPDLVTYADWQIMDAHEISAPPAGRCRHKIKTRAEMLALGKASKELL
ncbi:FAD-dependent oxidoreductase [Phaeobacter sp. J2-8]|uniref:FAD-dependent oxidoreductase n=1 Tax=Phaeobacter sp. J2-8 TaxID=2931394 RepID=UPI001FD4AC25|nr:FAD-dependent oxidoreductase [Phaeobacter sp. J2-8]MCJ7873515.1 FAD-dependent oxidoreductase [Phaeobacter sp. J2-8]